MTYYRDKDMLLVFQMNYDVFCSVAKHITSAVPLSLL